jgi:hypothetical protein
MDSGDVNIIELYELCKDTNIVNINDVKLRLQWAGLRIPEGRVPRKVMMGRVEGVRPMVDQGNDGWMDGRCSDRCEGITESEELENAGTGQERMETHN